MKKIFVALIVILAAALLVSLKRQNHNFKPERGYVPDKTTAIAIATAIWSPIYGAKNIESKKPFVANLVDNKVWMVKGTLVAKRYSPDSSIVYVTMGGVPYIEIRKEDCKILKVTHGK